MKRYHPQGQEEEDGEVGEEEEVDPRSSRLPDSQLCRGGMVSTAAAAVTEVA